MVRFLDWMEAGRLRPLTEMEGVFTLSGDPRSRDNRFIFTRKSFEWYQGRIWVLDVIIDKKKCDTCIWSEHRMLVPGLWY
jgi:hypothetical protein